MTKFLSLEGLTTLIAKLKSYFAAKGEAIKSITGSGNRTISYLRADNTQGSFSYQDTTYGTGNTSTAGLTKLYTSLGTQTDGAPTNKLLSDTKTELINKISSSISAIDRTLFVVVSTLPTKPATGNENKIHLVPMTTAKGTTQKYTEYVYANNAWEELGSFKAETDLSDYSTTDQVKALIKAETDARTAADTALGNRIATLEGDEDVFVGTAGNAADGIPKSYSGYWLATNDEPFVFKVTNGAPMPVATIGTFLFNDTATGDWYIVDTGKSTTKVQTSITDSEITALFS